MRTMMSTTAQTKQLADKLRKEFEKQLKSLKVTNKKLTISLDIQNMFKSVPVPLKDRPLVSFSYKAWLKMTMMTQRASHEIALHGFVKSNVEDNSYFVTDVVCYPQEVAAATVQASDDYLQWIMELPEDDLNSMRFQMHSHVNMPTTPSAVDTEYYDSMVSQTPDFYIFMILNKKGEVNLTIYDKTRNTVFEDEDIDITIVDQNEELYEWLDSADTYIDMKTKPAYKAPGSTTYFDTEDEYWAALERRYNTSLPPLPKNTSTSKKKGR